MVTVEDMGGTPVLISSLGFMPSASSQRTGSYHEFSLLLGYTDLDELSPRFNDNWSILPEEVFSDPQLELTGVSGGQWILFEFSDPFMYDGTSNLLLELSWDGPVDPPDSKIYSMNWDNTVNTSLIGFSPDSATGYVTTLTPNLLFVTSEAALETQTFAGIKSSF